ncbi:hypothetical protein C7G62_19140 [Acinetobacter baumannii]|nr:hypothetical protein C7G62_19140 [Acinetobacter baumannii]
MDAAAASSTGAGPVHNTVARATALLNARLLSLHLLATVSLEKTSPQPIHETFIYAYAIHLSPCSKS